MTASSSQIAKPLAPRETEVLQLLQRGYSREEIAAKLDISKLTYDSYRRTIRNKLNIQSQADWARVLQEFPNPNQ